jgi:hypothetical protein
MYLKNINLFPLLCHADGDRQAVCEYARCLLLLLLLLLLEYRIVDNVN